MKFQVMGLPLCCNINYSTGRRRRNQSKAALKGEDENPATTSLSELPMPILMDIFSRLPIKTILLFRCVSKAWFSRLSDPYFVEFHRARAPLSIMLLSDFYPRNIYSNSIIPLSRLKLNQNQNPPGERFSLLTSCNGLLCLQKLSYKKDEIFLCNPVLGEYKTLPQLTSKGLHRRVRGFGFCQGTTNQYKVIQTLSYLQDQAEVSNILQVEILTLGKDTCWRQIGELPYQLVQPYYGAFLNGALHWHAHSHDNKTAFMCSFDLGNEQFQPFPCPPIQDYGHSRPTVNSISVGVSGGFLYFCDGFLEHNLDIWVMKNYGVKESWAKEFIIENPLISRLQSIYGTIHILNYGMNMSKEAIEGSEIIMLFGSEELLVYDTKSKAARKQRVLDIHSNYQAIPYHASLVSIKAAGDGAAPKFKDALG